MSESKQAVCYYRVSPIKSEQDFLSINLQQIIVQEFCKKNNYQIYKEFEEIASDDDKNKRELDEALKVAKK